MRLHKCHKLDADQYFAALYVLHTCQRLRAYQRVSQLECYLAQPANHYQCLVLWACAGAAYVACAGAVMEFHKLTEVAVQLAKPGRTGPLRS